MSYNTMGVMAWDQDLKLRITACAAQQGVIAAAEWAQNHMWNVVSSPGWDTAYQYALDTEVPEPGKNENVITDATILATVQPLLAIAPE